MARHPADARDGSRRGLDAAPPRADLLAAMDRPPALRRPLLDLLPAPARRVGGITLLTLTLWLASMLALFR